MSRTDTQDQQAIRAAIARHMQTIRDCTQKIQTLLRVLKVPQEKERSSGSQ